MDQSVLMWVIISAVILIAAYIHWRKEHAILVGDLLQIPNYFMKSLTILHKNRWIVLLPFAFFSVKFLMTLPKQMHLEQAYLEKFPFQSVGLLLPSASLSTLPGAAFAAIGPSIQNGVKYLEYAYIGLFSGEIMTVLFLVCAVFFNVIIREIGRRLDGKYPMELGRLGTILKAGLIVVPLCEIFYYLVLSGSDARVGRLSLGYAASFTEGIVISYLLSFLEGIILLGISYTIKARAVSTKVILAEGMRATPELYRFNIVMLAITFILMIPSLLKIGFPAHHWISHLDFWSWNLLGPAVPVLTLCVPFVIVFKNQSAYEAFRRTGKFILWELPNYLLMVITGVLLLSIPGVIEGVIHRTLNPFHFITRDLQFILGSVQIALAAWFAVAILAWFMDRVNHRILE